MVPKRSIRSSQLNLLSRFNSELEKAQESLTKQYFIVLRPLEKKSELTRIKSLSM